MVVPAARLIGCRAPDHDQRPVRRRRYAIEQTLRSTRLMRSAAGILARRLQLGEPVGIGGEQRYGSEGTREEIEVETGDDHVPAAIGQLLGPRHDFVPEELSLVDKKDNQVLYRVSLRLT